MPSDDVVKLSRIPIDANCASCKKKIHFGAYAYFVPETNDTICIECAVKRGWTSKQRAEQIVSELEIKEDIKALKKQRKIDAEDLLHLKEQIDLHKLSLQDINLNRQLIELVAKVNDYLQKCATIEEKTSFKKMMQTVEATQNLQKEVRDFLKTRQFLLERLSQKRKRKGIYPTPTEDDEEEIPQEEDIPLAEQ